MRGAPAPPGRSTQPRPRTGTQRRVHRARAVAPARRPAAGGESRTMAVYPAAEPRSFEHHVLDFLAYLEFERGLSRNTLEAYRSDLLQFGAFLARRGTDALVAEHG